MAFCILCGSELTWQSEFDAEDCGYTKDGLIGFYKCPNIANCNATFEIIDLFDEDYNNTDVYDYRFIKYTLDND